MKKPLEGHIEASLTRLGPELAKAMVSDAEGLDLSVSERLIVEWSNGSHRARATVNQARSEGGQLTLTLSLTTSEPDARHYPRLVGGISISFAPPPEPREGVDSWLQGEEQALSSVAFNAALDELMNFSVYGLAFESKLELQVGTPLLCELGLSRDQARWRTQAQVTRSWPVNEERHGVAIEFTSPPSGLIDVLAAYTIELQKLNT